MKLIFLDIDGTLTEPGSNVPPESALKAIRKTQENAVRLSNCLFPHGYVMTKIIRHFRKRDARR